MNQIDNNNQNTPNDNENGFTTNDQRQITRHRCAVIGCTGVAGQQFLEALDHHPWFQVTSLHAHSNIGDLFRHVRRGVIAHQLSDEILDLPVQAIDALNLN